MNKLFDTYIPDGFSTVNVYLFVSDPQGLINFLKNAFYAEELNRTLRGQDIANCILKIGHSCIMVSQAGGKFDGMRSANYLYVDDVDALHNRAVQFGAKEEFGPADMDYGDRQSGIEDPSGNYWWISKRLVKKAYTD